MLIRLVRHGKPEVSVSSRWVNGKAISSWLENYNQAPLHPASLPSEELREAALAFAVVVSSDLRRSRDSAALLRPSTPLISSEIFREAELPLLRIPLLKLPPSAWTVALRAAWGLGFSGQAESFAQFRLRSRKAAQCLIELANNHQSAIFVGHGLINRSIAKELRRRGWRGPGAPSSAYWSGAVYRFKSGLD